MNLLGRLLIWLADVLLQLLLVVLGPVLTLVGALLAISVRLGLRLAAYPETWAITAVVVLWLFTNRSTIPSVIAVTAIIATLTVTFVRSRL